MAFHKRMARRPDFTWLEPPSLEGRMAVLDVLGARDPREHERRVRDWAADVWETWVPHQGQIRAWLAESGASMPGSDDGPA